MWWDYQDAEEQKKRLQREIVKRTKRGEKFEVLAAPAGQKKLCTTFWGQAWNKNLESYQVYESRLPRGRSYLRQGKVYNLEITPGQLSAMVAGSALYDTHIHIQPLPAKQWKEIVKSGAGEVGSMLDLLSGRLGDGLMRLLTDPERGLFPKPKEIRFNCSCPDHADMCKHVSAVLYGVGVLLDTKPELLFTLRGVDQAELLSDASSTAIGDLSTSGDDLAGTDLSALFGIDLGGDASALEEPAPTPAPAEPVARKVKKTAAKKAAKAAKKKASLPSKAEVMQKATDLLAARAAARKASGRTTAQGPRQKRKNASTP